MTIVSVPAAIAMGNISMPEDFVPDTFPTQSVTFKVRYFKLYNKIYLYFNKVSGQVSRKLDLIRYWYLIIRYWYLMICNYPMIRYWYLMIRYKVL